MSAAHRSDPDSVLPGAPSPPVSGTEETRRLDKWLWATRVFKTRALSAEACRAGHAEINGAPAKPAREVRAGETIRLKQGLMLRTLVVRGIPPNRVGAKLVSQYLDDQTSEEELAKARERSIQQTLARARGTGRPTKKDRREMEQLFGEE